METLTGAIQYEWKLRGELVTALAIDPSESLVAVGYETGVVEAIGLSDGHRVFSQTAHNAPVKLLKFSPSGEYLVSGLGLMETVVTTRAVPRRDPTPQRLTVWQPRLGRRHFEINDAVGSPQSVSFNSSETRLALAKVGGSLEVYDTMLGVRLLTFDDEHCCPASAVSFHPRDDDLLVSASSCTQFLNVWSGASQVPIEDADALPDAK
ncbi:MAG: WD40 repeat domain-containing protein [Verrucomicrobiota bacterium]